MVLPYNGFKTGVRKKTIAFLFLGSSFIYLIVPEHSRKPPVTANVSLALYTSPTYMSTTQEFGLKFWEGLNLVDDPSPDPNTNSNPRSVTATVQSEEAVNQAYDFYSNNHGFMRLTYEGKPPNDLSEEEHAQGKIVIVTVGTAPIDFRHLSCLKDETYLNDEIINAYLYIAKQAFDPSNTSTLITNTQLYQKMHANGSKEFDVTLVQTWHKGVNIFNLDFVAIPVHLLTCQHWICVCIDVKKGLIVALDSWSRTPRDTLKTILDNILTWVKQENEFKFEGQYNLQNWGTAVGESIMQANEYDCGVFACFNILYYVNQSRQEKRYKYLSNHSITFLRKKMLTKIVGWNTLEIDRDSESSGSDRESDLGHGQG
jgi:Ulp1 family protease